MKLPDDLIARARSGPTKDDDDPATYTIGMYTPNGEKERKLIVDGAVVHHYPDVAEPTHVIVWARASIHIFDYHALEYISREK